MMKRMISILLGASLLFSLVGCGNETAENLPSASVDVEVSDSVESSTEVPVASNSDAVESQEDTPFPFTLVTQDDIEVTFTHVPERVLACSPNAGDQLMALGLEDKIIATNYNITQINPIYQEAYDAIPVASDGFLSMEAVLDLDPDFAYGRNSAFSDKYNTTHQNMEMNGIMSLASIEGYKVGADVEDVYQDFYNLGRIFQVEDRAEEVVSAMKAQITTVEDAVQDYEPVKVFVYDVAQEGGAYTCGNNFTSQLISHAGGENIFSDLDTTWATVSWEEIIDRAPEVIIINDYGSTSLEEKYAELMENPALAEIPAIANNRIISVTLCEVFACSMTGDTIEKFGVAFHPEAF